jgi:rubrerythrin
LLWKAFEREVVMEAFMRNGTLAKAVRDPVPLPSPQGRLVAMAVSGEKIAAETYVLMSLLRSEHSERLRGFAAIETQHAATFADAGRREGLLPDRLFTDRVLGSCIAQIGEHYAARDFDALAIVQSFVVEALAIATYEPFARGHRNGTHEAFRRGLDEERQHVEWLTRYLRLRYFGEEESFLAACARVNTPCITGLGRAFAEIGQDFAALGIEGADCASSMMVQYRGLLDRVGVEHVGASRHVEQMFRPVLQE